MTEMLPTVPPAVAIPVGSVPTRTGTSASVPAVSMRFRPATDYLDGIREFALFFCKRTFSDNEIAQRVTVIVQEALENALKYSFPGSQSELHMEVDADRNQMAISVASEPDPAHLEELRKELVELYKRDAEAAYFFAFQRAANNPTGPSHIGLARIRYEGKADIQLHESDGRIRFTATGAL